ncbi:TPA: hypothetical protein DF272_03490 [Candidatus Falkowbacteria bacterium]|nr:hypothetical protein [Candidatus Falkowbacteria bacterium]
MQEIFGTSTMLLAIIMIVIGLPSQIRKNKHDKRAGLSYFMTILPPLVYISRIIYSIVIEAWFLIIPDGLGIIFCVILFGQYFKYRKFQPDAK